MKNRILFKFLVLIIMNSLWTNINAQQTATLKEISIKSKFLNQKRPVYIYLPSEYNERNLVSFDVIYVFDSQNRELFDLVHSSYNFIFSEKKQFIVIGISSPSYDKIEYYRNSDYLPKPINISIDKYQTDKPNAENFWKYFKEEVITFINSNYRTTNTNYLIGHSLSASFVLDKAINSPELFRGFLCVSPNFAYDSNRLANDFINMNFNKVSEKKFLYLSQSNEAKSMRKEWVEAYNRVKTFIDSTKSFGKYELNVKEFPEFDHWKGFLPSITFGLDKLANFIEQNPYSLKGNLKEISFKVSVPNKNDEVFITGNQESLGNWNPSKVKLNKISDLEREITIKVKFPIEFKLTKGSWETVGFTNQNHTANFGENIVINNPNSNKINLKVEKWTE